MSSTVEREVPEDAPPAPDAPEEGRPADVGVGDEGVAAADDEARAVPLDVTTYGDPRWSVGLLLALALGTVGVLTGTPTTFLAAAVPLAFAAYGHLVRPPPVDLAVSRTVSDDTPTPGDRVAVTVSVTNDGDRPIPDLRVVDGAPATLPVVEGSPRRCVGLGPGEETRFSYTLPARRGDHEFGETVLVARNVNGSVVSRAAVAVPTPLSVRSPVERFALRGQTVPYSGRVETREGGEGLEFHSARRYAPGDPMNRIDWRRFASTNELRSIDFRESRAATAVVLLDAREASAVASGPEEPDGVAHAEHAAAQVAAALLAEHNEVGAAALGRGGYVRTGTGRDQALRVRRFLDDPHSLDGSPHLVPGVGRRDRIGRLRSHFPADAQVVFCTPLVDEAAVGVARRLAAHGHAVTVVSPDVTSDTPGGRVVRVERDGHLDTLRADGIRAVDWAPDEPLRVATERAERRWSA